MLDKLKLYMLLGIVAFVLMGTVWSVGITSYLLGINSELEERVQVIEKSLIIVGVTKPIKKEQSRTACLLEHPPEECKHLKETIHD